ncbi:MAG: DUF1554 domain-containing protein [Polyangiaceae bacterium]
MTAEPVGSNCGAGGVKIQVGLDNGDGEGTANDGTLQPDEVDQTSYVCNGLSGRVVFVTSTTTNGDLGGLTGADAMCQTRANAAGLQGQFLAWLSDSSQSPSTRFVHSSAPYVLVDGTQIASNWAGLTSGTLDHYITLDEAGATGPTSVWTGTRDDGTVEGPFTCEDWTIPFAPGAYGFSGGDWTDEEIDDCNSAKALYCFQQ